MSIRLRIILMLQLFTGRLTLIIEQNTSELLVQTSDCAEHFQCLDLNRNNDHLQHLKMNSTLPNWYELCNCDQYCYLFGDCCPDAPIVQQLNYTHWSFVRVRFSSRINFLSLMKNHCPNEWADDPYIKQQCEQSTIDPFYHYLLPEIEQYLLYESDEEFRNWHVTSRQTLITYRNIYCSICNNDTQTVAWNQRLMCQENGHGQCTATYHQMAPDNLGQEKLKRIPLQNKVYTGCNLGWYKINYGLDRERTLQIVKQCIIFYAPVVVQEVKSKKFIVFKNKFCAQCNNYEDPKMIQCSSVAVDQSTQVPATFNLITTFDVNYTQGSIIDFGNNDKHCPANTVFNPISNFCQEIFIKSDSDVNVQFRSSNHVKTNNYPLVHILSLTFVQLIFIINFLQF